MEIANGLFLPSVIPNFCAEVSEPRAGLGKLVGSHKEPHCFREELNAS